MHTQVALHVTGQLFMNKVKETKEIGTLQLAVYNGPKLHCWQQSKRCTLALQHAGFVSRE